MTTQITLPRDAEGREIPLDTSVLYDASGKGMHVKHVDFNPFSKEWVFYLIEIDGMVFRKRVLYPWQAYIEKPAQPDSWDKLEEDLKNAAEKASNSPYVAPCCVWFNGGNRGCADCPADESPNDSCNVQLVKNIAARIRKLRGEGE